MAIKNRNIVTCVILTIITCGIYGIYWGIMMIREAISVKDPSDGGILEIVLMFVPYVNCLSFFLTEKKLAEGCTAKGIAHEDRSILYLILGLLGLGIVNFCLLQNDLNGLANAE